MADHSLSEQPRKIDWAMLGMILTLLFQGATALWWASKMDARVAQLEQTIRPMAQMSETVARLDERTKGIDRIEQKLEKFEAQR